MKQLYIWLLIGIAIFSIMPFVLGPYGIHVLIVGFYYGVLAVSFGVVTIVGKHNFGFIVLPMIGAYASGLLAVNLNIPVLVTVLIGGVVTVAFSYVVGFLTIRLRGPYFALTTFALAQAVAIPMIVEYQWTGGTLGLYVPSLLGVAVDPRPDYFFTLGFFVVFLLVIYRTLNSKIGLFMKAIGDDDLAASHAGINVTKTITMVFALTSFFAGLAGAIVGHHIQIIAPSMFTTNETALIMAMAFIGGVGSFLGPAAGGIMINAISEYMRSYAAYRWVLFGAILIVILRFLPGGMSGILKSFWTKYLHPLMKRAPSTSA
jgi:branched-chain amino acid transport system permease protein